MAGVYDARSQPGVIASVWVRRRGEIVGYKRVCVGGGGRMRHTVWKWRLKPVPLSVSYIQCTCACSRNVKRQTAPAVFHHGKYDVLMWWCVFVLQLLQWHNSFPHRMFATTAVIEAGFYQKWSYLGWTPSNIDLSEKDLVSEGCEEGQLSWGS